MKDLRSRVFQDLDNCVENGYTCVAHEMVVIAGSYPGEEVPIYQGDARVIARDLLDCGLDQEAGLTGEDEHDEAIRARIVGFVGEWQRERGGP